MKIITNMLFVMIALVLSVNANAVSLWTEYDNYNSMYDDHRARSIGDIVTILITESTSASKDSKTDTNREDDITMSITSLLYPLANSKALTHKGALPKVDWESKKEFEGGGKMNNKETFSAKITARVIDVMPNGNLLVEGRRTVSMQKEQQTIVITGIIRPRDISQTNTIESQYIADMQVRYSGKGPIANNQRKGFLSHLWDVINIL